MCAGTDHEVAFGRGDLGDLGEESRLADARLSEHVNPVRTLSSRMTMLANQAQFVFAPHE